MLEQLSKHHIRIILGVVAILGVLAMAFNLREIGFIVFMFGLIGVWWNA